MSERTLDLERPPSGADPPRLSRRSTVLSRWRGQAALVLLVLLTVIGVLFVDRFASVGNVIQIVQSQAFVGIVAVGMTWVVLSGNFVDLSVPSVMAVAANAVLILNARSLPLAVIVALVIPLGIGAVNGLLVGLLRLNPIIATLGVTTLVGGALFLATTGDTALGTDVAFRQFGRARVLGVPVAAIVFVVLLCSCQALLTRTRFGHEVRFVGSNREAARSSGVRDTAVVVWCFVLVAASAAIAGTLLSAFSNTAELVTGRGYEFDALAAVVIGGTTLQGGVGSFWRTLAGVLVIGLANNIMLLLGLDTSVQLLVKAGVFILAVALDALANREQST